MKRSLLLIALILFFGVSTVGCSYLTMRPQLVRYHVNNGPHEVKDMFVVLDSPSKKKFDIRFNNHYAIQFDLNRYSNENNAVPMASDGTDNQSISQLAPYIIWTYQF